MGAASGWRPSPRGQQKRLNPSAGRGGKNLSPPISREETRKMSGRGVTSNFAFGRRGPPHPRKGQCQGWVPSVGVSGLYSSGLSASRARPATHQVPDEGGVPLATTLHHLLSRGLATVASPTRLPRAAAELSETRLPSPCSDTPTVCSPDAGASRTQLKLQPCPFQAAWPQASHRSGPLSEKWGPSQPPAGLS